MGSCTSKGPPNSKQSSRKTSKVDFQLNDMDFPPIHLIQEKSSHNTTAQRIPPHVLVFEEHQSSRKNKSKGNTATGNGQYTPGNGSSTPSNTFNGADKNDRRKSDENNWNDKGSTSLKPIGKSKNDVTLQQGKEGIICTQNTHTDCDVQFTSFEFQPKNIPKGSFVGANNLSEPSSKRASGYSSKKIMKEYFLQSRSDKKSRGGGGGAIPCTLGGKKCSSFTQSSQEMQQDIEDKQLALSCIAILKAFYQQPTVSSGLTSPSQQHKPSIFDHILMKANNQSFELIDKQILCLLNNNINNSKGSDIAKASNQGTSVICIQEKNAAKGIDSSGQLNYEYVEQPMSGKKKVNTNHFKKDLAINVNNNEGIAPGDGRSSVSQLVPPSQPKLNLGSLGERDQTLLVKYAKNWQQLGRSYAVRQDWNETLSCLLPSCQLYIALGFGDHLVALLAEAYIAIMMLMCSPIQDESADKYDNSELGKAQQKFMFIRTAVLSAQLQPGIIPKLSNISSNSSCIQQIQQQQQQQPAACSSQQLQNTPFQPAVQQIQQQEPSQKNTEKTFLFDEWRSMSTPYASLKEKSANELLLFLDMLHTALKPQPILQRTLASSLPQFLDAIKQSDSYSPFLSSLFADFNLLQQVIILGGKDSVMFDNREASALLELFEVGGIEKVSSQKYASVSRFLRRIVSECGTELLMRFAEEASKASEVSVSLKEKNMSDILMKLGHLLRIWLELPNIALFFYQQSFTEDPSSCQALFFSAITMRTLNKTSEAIQYYNQALEIDHYYQECYINLGNIYLEDYSNLEVAERFYVKALVASQLSTSATTVPKGLIYHLLGETNKINQELGLATVFYTNGVLKDALYEENYYDLIEALEVGEIIDSRDAKEYFKIVIDLVSFSLFEKENWKAELLLYQTELRRILKKYKGSTLTVVPSKLDALFDNSTESEEAYFAFTHNFCVSSLEASESFSKTLIERTVQQNVKEIGELFARKSLHEESPQEDMPYITIIKDLLSEFALD